MTRGGNRKKVAARNAKRTIRPDGVGAAKKKAQHRRVGSRKHRRSFGRKSSG